MNSHNTNSSIDNSASYENELALTNELLMLLDDFRNKSYSVKEMEAMFDTWRKKASIYDFPNKHKVIEKYFIRLVRSIVPNDYHF